VAPRSHCANLNEEHGLNKQASYYELGKMGPNPGTNRSARRRLSRNLLAPTSRSRADRQKMGQAMIDLSREHICKDGLLLDHLGTGKSTEFRARCHMYTSEAWGRPYQQLTPI